MEYERVLRPWVLAESDNDGDVQVIAAAYIIVSVF
jgi:hypothetical protein